MIVASVGLRGFMGHADTVQALPPSGIVLVTGPNGAGKSSLVEAVAWVVYGKTLRGTEPWDEGPCEADVHLWRSNYMTRPGVDRLSGPFVDRSRSGGKTRLRWKGGTGGVTGDWHEFENATKAQEALNRLVLPWEVWRRACVFSTADAAHFTLAGDAERKRTLELLFGLDAFERAHEICRGRLREADEAHRAAKGELDLVRSAAKEAAVSEEHLRVELARVPSGPVEADLARLVELEEQLAAIPVLPKAGLDPAYAEATRHDAEAKSLGLRLQQVRDGRCRACGQPVSADAARAMAAQVELEEAAAQRAYGEWTSRAREQARREDAVRQARSRLEAEMRGVDGRVDAARGASEVRGRLVEALATAAARSATLRSQEKWCIEQEVDYVAEVSVLERSALVLGVRGLRAQLLSRALDGVGGVANTWLSRLAGGRDLRLRLSPTTEQASGKVVDVVSLEVEGVGGGRGYRAASGGERRRIDLALTIALAESSASVRGAEGSTLFFDEVADGLDADGSQAAASALRELARSRTVVVISHTAALQAALEPDLHLRVEGGKVSRG